MHTPARKKIDYGPPLTIHLCLLRAPGVSEARADDLVRAVNKEMALYSIQFVVAWTRPWTRNGFTAYQMFTRDLYRRDLEPPCDRLVALVDRNVGDFLWGLTPMPEILGAVDNETHTHGMVVAVSVTLTQTELSPKDAAVHEFYHLLGCPHALTLTGCYSRIAELKHHADPNAGFVPGMTQSGGFLLSRDAVNEVLRVAIAEEDAKSQRAAAPARVVDARRTP